MASKTSTRERRRGRGGKGERLSSEFSLGVFWQIYVFYDGGNFEVNNGEDGGRRGGAAAAAQSMVTDGVSSWKTKLHPSPSLSPSFPLPFGRLILGVTAMLARRRGILGRPARRGAHNLPDLEQLHYTIRSFAQSSFKMATHPFITAKI